MKHLWILSLAVFFTCMLTLNLAESDCPVNPEYWCNSEDIARSCGVSFINFFITVRLGLYLKLDLVLLLPLGLPIHAVMWH